MDRSLQVDFVPVPNPDGLPFWQGLGLEFLLRPLPPGPYPPYYQLSIEEGRALAKRLRETRRLPWTGFFSSKAVILRPLHPVTEETVRRWAGEAG